MSSFFFLFARFPKVFVFSRWIEFSFIFSPDCYFYPPSFSVYLRASNSSYFYCLFCISSFRIILFLLPIYLQLSSFKLPFISFLLSHPFVTVSLFFLSIHFQLIPFYYFFSRLLLSILSFTVCIFVFFLIPYLFPLISYLLFSLKMYSDYFSLILTIYFFPYLSLSTLLLYYFYISPLVFISFLFLSLPLSLFVLF